MGSNYKWNKKEVLTEYLKSIKNVIKTRGKDLSYRNDNANLSDMLRVLFNEPLYRLHILSVLEFKGDLLRDSDFFNEHLTDFQRKNIEKIIRNVLEENFYIYSIESEFDNKNINYIDKLLEFLNEINPLLSNELKSVINNNRLYIDSKNKNTQYSGSCFTANNKNYYQIIPDKITNVFMTLNHENVHGLTNILSNRKFDNDKSIILYRELGSILIELYSNQYLFNNDLISEEEYIYNYNYIYLCNLYSNIELLDFLYRLSKLDTNKSKRNIRKLIDVEVKEKPNYDFGLYELNELPLEHHLTYLYSSSVAIALFNMFKDNPKSGMDAAIDIMLNVNKENEEELFKKYNINICNSLDIYKKENNRLIKKKRC